MAIKFNPFEVVRYEGDKKPVHAHYIYYQVNGYVSRLAGK
jgi:hypothetical protein